MRKLMLMFIGLFAIVAAWAQKPVVVTDNDPGWHRIGQITASFSTETESIVVYGRDEFTGIRLKATDAPIHIEKVEVFFEEGGSQEIAVGKELQAGEETDVLDLKGSNKELENVTFTYRTLPNYKGDKATVELYGHKARTDRTDAFRGDREDVEEEGEEAADEVREEGREAREDARETRDDVREGARETRDDVREGARETRDDVREGAREARDEAREDLREGRDEVREESNEAREELRDETREERAEIREEEREARKELREEKRQADNAAKRTGEDIEEGAEKVAEEVSEAAASTAAHVKDKVYVDKVGPDGETIFIDKHSKYYYIGEKGKKVYVSKWQLKDKPDRK